MTIYQLLNWLHYEGACEESLEYVEDCNTVEEAIRGAARHQLMWILSCNMPGCAQIEVEVNRARAKLRADHDEAGRALSPHDYGGREAAFKAFQEADRAALVEGILKISQILVLV